MMRLASIGLHPVKSTAIRRVERADVGPAGLRGDREWMVVDGRGALVSARELPRLFHVVADTPATGGPDDVDLRLSAPGSGSIDLAHPVDGERDVDLWGQMLPARAAGADADAWLRAAVGRDDVSLVWCADPGRRELAGWARPTDRAAFQDESPVSVATTASMGRLNDWMADSGALPVSRFRANLVVDGELEPFAEDAWSSLRVGEAVLRVAQPISRCVMTTIDAVTLEKGKDPIRTLARHRSWDGKTWFAVHLMVERQGRVAVGDAVIVE